MKRLAEMRNIKIGPDRFPLHPQHPSQHQHPMDRATSTPHPGSTHTRGTHYVGETVQYLHRRPATGTPPTYLGQEAWCRVEGKVGGVQGGTRLICSTVLHKAKCACVAVTCLEEEGQICRHDALKCVVACDWCSMHSIVLM